MITGCLLVLLPILYIVVGGYWVNKHASPIAYRILHGIPFAAFYAHSYGMAMYAAMYEGFCMGVTVFIMLIFASTLWGLLFNLLLTFYMFLLESIARLTKH